MRLKISQFFLWACITSGYAQIPEYYSSIDFTASATGLKNQLSELIQNTHTTQLNYTPDVWNLLKTSDLENPGSSKMLLIYGYNDTDANASTDRTRDKNLSCHTSDCNGLWVREHVFPRSLGTPNLGFENAGSDAHNLRPIDNQMNNSRSNRKFASGSGNAAIVANGNFYPGDEWKGDIARMMMYLYLRYPSQCPAVTIGTGSITYSSFNDMPDIFLEWNQQDPVSALERKRNDVIQVFQGNRNPFIDNPYLATLIWNGPEAENTWTALSIEKVEIAQWQVYPTVTTDKVYIKYETQNIPDHYQYQLYNMQGQLVIQGTTSSEIDVSASTPGIYILKIQADNAVKTVRIIKK